MRRGALALGLLTAACATPSFDGPQWAKFYDGMDWLYDAERRTIFYGVDESDVFVLRITCGQTPTHVAFSYLSGLERRPRRSEQLILAAAGHRYRFPAVTDTTPGDETYDYLVYDAAVPTTVFASLAGHRISLGINRLSESPIDPLPVNQAQQLVAACGA